MRTPPTNLCPMRGGTCSGDNCAWWDYLAHECCMVSGADYIRDVADQITALTVSLEELAAKSQTFGNLKKKTAPSAANTEDGGVEQSLPDTDSTSDNT